jgi:hypothetical protein
MLCYRRHTSLVYADGEQPRHRLTRAKDAGRGPISETTATPTLLLSNKDSRILEHRVYYFLTAFTNKPYTQHKTSNKNMINKCGGQHLLLYQNLDKTKFQQLTLYAQNTKEVLNHLYHHKKSLHETS